MSNTMIQTIWALVCDDDVQEMSEALGQPYSLGDFVSARLAIVSANRSEVHAHQRIDSDTDPALFTAKLDWLHGQLCRTVFTAIAQLAADMGEPLAAQPATCDIAAIMRLGANVLRRIEARLESGDEIGQVSSAAFRRTLAELSSVLAGNFNERSFFADVTEAVPVAILPDEAWTARAVADPRKRYLLVPVRFAPNEDQPSI